MNLAELLKSARQSRGLQQADVATAIGCSKSSICLYESGERVPSVEVLIGLLDFYCIDIMSISSKRELIDITDCSQSTKLKIYSILKSDKTKQD